MPFIPDITADQGLRWVYFDREGFKNKKPGFSRAINEQDMLEWENPTDWLGKERGMPIPRPGMVIKDENDCFLIAKDFPEGVCWTILPQSEARELYKSLSAYFA